MDIEDVIGLAPQATIDVYQAPQSTDQDVYDVYSAIVNQSPPDPVVTTSWGECELDEDGALRTEESYLFQQAAAEGQTFIAAAGDTGAADCNGDPGTKNGKVAAVDDPASQPDVVGVGGTSISAGSETAWKDGGGGVSSNWCMPSYQDQPQITGLISSVSVLAPPAASCPAGSYLRQVPDVSADADPETGYVVYWHGSWLGGHAGTSAAAPLWAAAAALIDASPFCSYDGSGDPGVLPQGLYSIAALGQPFYDLAFNDITSGNNSFESVAGYSATAGYDMVSGLGSPRLTDSDMYYPGLAAQMCLDYRTNSDTTQISGVSPDTGAVGQATTVTITGTGFLPIPGADRLQVGSTTVVPACSTATSCTATLPAGGPGTVDLVMSVEDSATSPVEASDRFDYAYGPSITRLAPAVGPEKGGTTVTIWGDSFVGEVSVRVGGKPATDVQVISPSELSAAVPPGSGVATVTVSTPTGSSAATPTTNYTFVAAPAVTGLSPAFGPKKGGTTVTIRGSNFVGPVSVRFGRKRASHLHVSSWTRLSVTVPSGVGAAAVTVSALGGSSRTSAKARYRFLPAPAVDTLSPPRGASNGGAGVRIRGAGFYGEVSVHFGAKAATQVRVLSPTDIVATAPPGSGTVEVVVSTAGGRSRARPTAMYRYLGPPPGQRR